MNIGEIASPHYWNGVVDLESMLEVVPLEEPQSASRDVASCRPEEKKKMKSSRSTSSFASSMSSSLPSSLSFATPKGEASSDRTTSPLPSHDRHDMSPSLPFSIVKRKERSESTIASREFDAMKERALGRNITPSRSKRNKDKRCQEEVSARTTEEEKNSAGSSVSSSASHRRRRRRRRGRELP